jgi:hypothetical protein
MNLSKLLLFVLCCFLLSTSSFGQSPVHVWEMQELTFNAGNTYKNPYTEAKMWVDLTGPNFNKRIFGFWDGGNVFKVRIVATSPGAWTWKSGSSTNDPGLSNKSGTFNAVAWSDNEKKENPLRHGFIRVSPGRHALDSCRQYAVLCDR